MPKKTTKDTKKAAKVATKTTRKSAKKSLVDKYKGHKKDTGSTEVQIATLSEQVAELSKHLKKHKKDNDSRLGLLMKVGKRRKLLNYLALNDEKKYEKLIKDLKLKK